MTTYLGKSCSFGLPRVPFVNCCQFMYLVVSLLVLRAGCGIWLYQFLIIAYLFTLNHSKALGPGELHPRVLKELATELGPVFVNPREKVPCKYLPPFQEEWQVTCVQLSPGFLDLCTLLEHIVCSNIMANLDEIKLLSDRQHASMKGHRCETQLTTVVNDWAKSCTIENRLTHSSLLLKGIW